MIEAIIYLIAITAAELVTVYVHPVWGMVFHIVILVLVIVRSAVSVRYPYQPLLLCLALVPLVRIISLSMPLANIPQIWWYPIVYGPLVVAAIVVMRILNYKPGQVGLTLGRQPVKKWWPVQLVVALSGIGFGIAEYIILAPEPMVAELTWQAVRLPALIFLLTTGFVEELIFRGVLQRSALEALGRWGIVYVSLIFAVLHIGFLSGIDVAFVFAVALFFSWIVQKTGSLIGVTLSHGVTNMMLYLIAPFLLG